VFGLDKLDTTHDQVEGLTLGQVAKELQRSEKTIRRYLKQGRFDQAAVHAEKTATGFRYRIDLDAVTALKAELDQGRKLDSKVDIMGSNVLDTQALVQAVVEQLRPVLVQAIRDENADLRAQIERLTTQVAEYQRALPPAPEEGKRSWWRRLRGR